MSTPVPCPINVQMLGDMCQALDRWIDASHITPLDDELRYIEALDMLRRAAALVEAHNNAELAIHRDLSELFHDVQEGGDGDEYEFELGYLDREVER
jgi:hypothetical protein